MKHLTPHKQLSDLHASHPILNAVDQVTHGDGGDLGPVALLHDDPALVHAALERAPQLGDDPFGGVGTARVVRRAVTTSLAGGLACV